MPETTNGELHPYKKSLLILIIAFFIIWLLLPNVYPPLGPWVTMLTMPARQVGILIHEMGHGLGAILTGGVFSYLQLIPFYGGVAYTAGGFSLIILLLGLWGPTLFGVALMIGSVSKRNPKQMLVALLIFFLLSLYFMLTPLFLPSSRLPAGIGFTFTQLFALLVPLSCIAVILHSFKMRTKYQRLILQVSGILSCFSGYSDNRYIFHYPALGPDLYSDAREVAGSVFLVGAANVPYSLFFVVACGISLVNFGLLFWGLYTIYKTK